MWTSCVMTSRSLTLSSSVSTDETSSSSVAANDVGASKIRMRTSKLVRVVCIGIGVGVGGGVRRLSAMFRLSVARSTMTGVIWN